jgi:hypothetical protein
MTWEEAKRRAAGRNVIREKDIELLRRLVDDVELRGGERPAFNEMLRGLIGGTYEHLTIRQREWVSEVAKRIGCIGYENLVSTGRVPRGREVAEPEILKRRPLKPPGRS